MAKILLTGASGFIGGHLLPVLAAEHEVVVLTRTPLVNPPAGVNQVIQDLTRNLDARQLPGRIDAVIHLAQSKWYKHFPERAADIFEVNVHGTFQLLEYARTAGAAHFVFASSGGVYGNRAEAALETDPVSPLDFYLSSKYAAELLVSNYRPYFTTVVLRFFFVYGPGQVGMLVPNLLGRVAAGQPISIEGKPGLRINPIFVGDAVRVFAPALAQATSGTFNVCGDEAVTISDLVALMGEQVGRAPMVTHTEVPSRGDLVGDNARMREGLGVVPRVSLREGLAAVRDAATTAAR